MNGIRHPIAKPHAIQMTSRSGLTSEMATSNALLPVMAAVTMNKAPSWVPRLNGMKNVAARVSWTADTKIHASNIEIVDPRNMAMTKTFIVPTIQFKKERDVARENSPPLPE